MENRARALIIVGVILIVAAILSAWFAPTHVTVIIHYVTH